MKKNHLWLLDQNYINTLDFSNKLYLSELFKYIYNFLISLPITPISTSKENVPLFKNNTLTLLIGSNYEHFVINEHIAYHDFLTVIESKLSKYFPQFEIEAESERDLTSEEITEYIEQNNVSLIDALELKKKDIIKETGIIYRTYMTDEKFNYLHNGIKEERLVYEYPKTKFPLVISKFMQNVRSLSGIELRDYIEKNSKFIKRLEDPIITISYTGEQFKNFMEINRNIIKTEPVLEGEYYTWGKFRFKNNILIK